MSEPYSFLSNFYPCSIILDEYMEFPSVEHAYQAAKTTHPRQRWEIALLPTAQEANFYGRRVLQARPGWRTMRLGVMESLLRYKFRKDSILRSLLLGTGQTPIVEVSHFMDDFWGTVDGVGQNQLGKMLMMLRSEFRQERERTPTLRLKALRLHSR